jgi:hypothetical protein
MWDMDRGRLVLMLEQTAYAEVTDVMFYTGWQFPAIRSR